MQINTTKVMEHKGFKAEIMEAERLTGEQTFGLPPGNALTVYHADSFKSYPENWMKGPGVFVVPVRPNKGLWFNWRNNDENNTAIIPTVKGCNPITGMQTTGFHLEKYETKCPKHGCNFEALRFCPECGYKWPDRNYVSGTPLWWDGFRSEGDVRQFFFTEEMMRDIATHMIGKENTVPAFGFAFYSPKEPRISYRSVTRGINISDNMKYLVSPSSIGYSTFPTTTKGSFLLNKGIKYKSVSKSSLSEQSYSGDYSSDDSLDSLGEPIATAYSISASFDNTVIQERCIIPQKEVAVGAGAKIRQELPVDNYALDTWKDTPDSVMTLYFVFQEEFDRMAAAGFKDFSDCKNGMLNGLPVG